MTPTSKTLKRIKVLLGLEKVNFITQTLTDGTVISFDELSVGAIVSKVEGEETLDLAPGTYELEDGTIIVIDEVSAIAEITLPIEMETQELEDGTKISYPELVVGAKVSKIDGEETMDFGPGTITLADGTIIEIDEASLIAVITTVNEEELEVASDPAVEERLLALETRLGALESALAAFIPIIEDEIASSTELSVRLKKIEKLPAAKPIQKANVTEGDKPITTLEKRMANTALIKKTKIKN